MINSLKCKLVGIRFQHPSKTPKAFDVVKLKLEPENSFDTNAIAVFNIDDEKIGYIGTDNTTYKRNKRNGFKTNIELKKIINIEDYDSYSAIIEKEKGYYGVIDIRINDI